MEHKHNWQYYKTDKSRNECGYRSHHFVVVEKFVCSECGETLEKKVGDDTFNQSEMDSLPLWVRSNFFK